MLQEKQGEDFLERDQGSCLGVHREVVVAFIEVANQHAIVTGLTGS